MQLDVLCQRAVSFQWKNHKCMHLEGGRGPVCEEKIHMWDFVHYFLLIFHTPHCLMPFFVVFGSFRVWAILSLEASVCGFRQKLGQYKHFHNK